MKTLIALGRGFSVWFLLTSILGYLWFLGTFDFWSNVYFFSTVPALVMAAFMPRRLYVIDSVRIGTLIVYITATIFTVSMIIKDISIINGPDHIAAIIRSVEILIFVIMFYEIILAHKGKVTQETT